MSPEQICAEGDIDGRSDQYSVALMLYEMLTGVRPHAAATVEGLRALRIAGHQHSVQAHRPMVPDYVNRAVMRAMSSSPADRFVDCGAFGRALRGDGVSAQAPAGVVKGTSSRRRVMGYAGAAVVLLLVGVAASMDLLQEPAGSAPVEAASMAPQPIRVVLLPGDDDATGTAQRVAQSLRTELTSWARVSVLDSSTSSYERARKDKRSELADVVEISALPGAADSSRALIRVVREDSTSEELLTPFAFRTADGPTPQVMKLVAMQIIGGRRATQDSSPGIETISRPDRVALS